MGAAMSLILIVHNMHTKPLNIYSHENNNHLVPIINDSVVGRHVQWMNTILGAHNAIPDEVPTVGYNYECMLPTTLVYNQQTPMQPTPPMQRDSLFYAPSHSPLQPVA